MQQIHETHADTVFGKNGNSQKTTEDKCSVAEAAKKLCCKILRYKRYRGIYIRVISKFKLENKRGNLGAGKINDNTSATRHLITHGK